MSARTRLLPFVSLVVICTTCFGQGVPQAGGGGVDQPQGGPVGQPQGGPVGQPDVGDVGQPDDGFDPQSNNQNTTLNRRLPVRRSFKTDPEIGFGYSYFQQSDSLGTESFGQSPGSSVPYDATAGLRKSRSGTPGFQLQAVDASGQEGIDAQPLIQIRVRVVDVLRNDTFAASSVLDYVSRDGNEFSLITGNNINTNTAGSTERNIRGATRFGVPGVLGLNEAGTALGTGTGYLVNLTSTHINYISNLLATEFEGDIVTAPEVTTLNGQNVEFMAGAKVPFELGQSVTTDNTTNIQQFFYKHVGTYISVTPRIVNWGPHGEGRGRVDQQFVGPEQIPFEPITTDDVSDFSTLLTALRQNAALNNAVSESFRNTALRGPAPAITDALRTTTLTELNWLLNREITVDGSSVMVDRFYLHDALDGTISIPYQSECPDCLWSPNDCTIDMEIVVRLSDATGMTVGGVSRNADPTAPQTAEDNVRAISNIVQVKSGNGVVMAGLIGESDSETTSKVPVLGDLPVVGFMFRAKETLRAKTETLIFVEARVLDREPCLTRAQTYHNFELGKAYVEGEFLDNPLEYGMYRAGFGTYLPPHSKDEQIFWEQHDRRIRKVATEIHDALK